MSDGREQKGRPTAGELYDELRAKGELTGWTGFCTVPDYCTSPCDDCKREGEISIAYIRGQKS